MRFLTAYVLACTATAAVPAVAMALHSVIFVSYQAIAGGPVQRDFFVLVFVAPLMNFVVFFGLLVAQSAPWTPVLFWTGDTRSRHICAVVCAPVFGFALYWLGAIGAAAGAPILGRLGAPPRRLLLWLPSRSATYSCTDGCA